jgi:hypothetical protein
LAYIVHVDISPYNVVQKSIVYVEVVFWLSGAYEPIVKNAQKAKFKMSKNVKEFACKSGYSMFANKFLEK